MSLPSFPQCQRTKDANLITFQSSVEYDHSRAHLHYCAWINKRKHLLIVICGVGEGWSPNELHNANIKYLASKASRVFYHPTKYLNVGLAVTFMP